MTDSSKASSAAAPTPPPAALMAVAWVWVAAPFAYGVYQLILKVTQLFQ